MTVKAEFPVKLQGLFRPARYKVAYGGRGSAKSWSFARALLLKGVQGPLRVLCAREFQNSIQESVHKLLSDQIEALGLSGFYRIQQTEISGPNGTTFNFEGIKKNVQRLKSYEGVDVCWLEEADAVSEDSWNILIPTIRKPGSEIWVTFNPNLEQDPTYQRFVVSRPTDAMVVKISWRDNPWFPEVLRQEMEDLKAKDMDKYLWVWEGNCRSNLEGAIFAKQIRLAMLEGRFTSLRWIADEPVDTFWDLGRSDLTTIWFRQRVGLDWQYIDYLQGSGEAIDYYIKQLQKLPYIYGTHWLPHDAKNKLLVHKQSIEAQVRKKLKTVRIVPKLRISDRIDAGRRVFDKAYFDEGKCAKGISALKNYKYEKIAGRDVYSTNPLHDEASHGADSFCYSGVAADPVRMEQRAQERESNWERARKALRMPMQSNGWMGR